MRRLLVTVSGGGLLLVGLLFAVVPFLPGMPLIVMGAGLLGSECPRLRRRGVRMARKLGMRLRSVRSRVRKMPKGGGADAESPAGATASGVR